MSSAVMWFPLGQNQHCVVEKTPRGWQLRVIRDGESLLTHPLEDRLAERLLSARGQSASDRPGLYDGEPSAT